jgi:hypothetical protein
VGVWAYTAGPSAASKLKKSGSQRPKYYCGGNDQQQDAEQQYSQPLVAPITLTEESQPYAGKYRNQH